MSGSAFNWQWSSSPKYWKQLIAARSKQSWIGTRIVITDNSYIYALLMQWVAHSEYLLDFDDESFRFQQEILLILLLLVIGRYKNQTTHQIVDSSVSDQNYEDIVYRLDNTIHPDYDKQTNLNTLGREVIGGWTQDQWYAQSHLSQIISLANSLFLWHTTHSSHVS